MALPLIPVALGLGAGGFLLWKGLRTPPSANQIATELKDTFSKPPKGGARRATFVVTKEDAFVRLVARLGTALAGTPTAPAIKLTGMSYFAQTAQRENGEKVVWIYTPGDPEAYLVRGGFYKIWAGREKMFGAPTSDEITEVRVDARLRKVNMVRQTFRNGYMIYNPKTKRSKGIWMPGGARGAKFTVADTKPRKKAWYESAWKAVKDEANLGDVAFVGVLAGIVIATAATCVVTVGTGCGPAIGLAIAGGMATACKAQSSVNTMRETSGGLTGGLCGDFSGYSNMASGEEDAEPYRAGDDSP